jgi:catechol 2,3-dioxygenase-like lactoylglutathione lyase family enzyme
MLHVVLDCLDPEALAPFWCEALGYRVGWSGGSFVVLEPVEPPGPPFLLQRVPEPKSGKNRAHVDIPTEDLEGDARRLAELGGRILSPQPVEEFGLRWLTLADPEGNEFDLVWSPPRA